MKDADIASLLDDAARNAEAVSQISELVKLTPERSYAVQKASVDLRLRRGEKRAGMKMGFTSRAKMIQMGISDLIWGRLTDGMMVEDGGATSRARYVHPRVEPEVAFVLKRSLRGRITPAQAWAAVEAVAPALEIIDSRYKNFKFSLADVVADNSSSSGFIVGPWCRPDTELSNLGLVMTFNGRPVAYGSSAAILGHPLRSLVAAARLADEGGEELPEGSIVLAGGATAAVELKQGTHVGLQFESIGRCSFAMDA
jgi:2-oxo-3-hexenedioate decarboxylase